MLPPHTEFPPRPPMLDQCKFYVFWKIFGLPPTPTLLKEFTALASVPPRYHTFYQTHSVLMMYVYLVISPTRLRPSNRMDLF